MGYVSGASPLPLLGRHEGSWHKDEKTQPRMARISAVELGREKKDLWMVTAFIVSSVQGLFPSSSVAPARVIRLAAAVSADG